MSSAEPLAFVCVCAWWWWWWWWWWRWRRLRVSVVEKSAVVADSLVVQRLLHEAYRFQAIRPDAADVDEHFPGNPRVKVRSR